MMTSDRIPRRPWWPWFAGVVVVLLLLWLVYEVGGPRSDAGPTDDEVEEVLDEGAERPEEPLTWIANSSGKARHAAG